MARPPRFMALHPNCFARPEESHPSQSAGIRITDPDLTLSRHPARAIARRLPPSIEHRVPPGVGWTQHQLTRAKWRWPAPFAPRALPRFITVESGEVERTPCLCPLAQTARAVFPQAPLLCGRHCGVEDELMPGAR